MSSKNTRKIAEYQLFRNFITNWLLNYEFASVFFYTNKGLYMKNIQLNWQLFSFSLILK